MGNIFARLAKKIVKKVEKDERGMDPLAAYRITGLHKSGGARPEMSDIADDVAIDLLNRVRK